MTPDEIVKTWNCSLRAFDVSFIPLASKTLPTSSLDTFLYYSLAIVNCAVLKEKLLTQRGLGFTCRACSALKLERDALQEHVVIRQGGVTSN